MAAPAGWPRMAHWRAMPAWTRATSRDSPSIESPRITGVTPASRATSAAASSEACGVAIMTFSTRAKQGSPGFGVSSDVSSTRRTASGTSILYFSMMARASSLVDGSGTVGPEAMIDGSSPGTSEIISATTCAG